MEHKLGNGTRAALLALMTLSTASAWAQGEALAPVEVQGHRLRSDVSSTCPGIRDALEEKLAVVVVREQIRNGSYPVLFDLQTDEVTNVRTPNSYMRWRQALRAAVRDLDCRDAASHQSVQRFGFILDVVDEPRQTRSAGLPSRVAVGLRPLE